MKAMVLAAGFGTRLRPLTHTLPKPLLPIAGRPLIVWNLLLLKQYGVSDVVINLHHLGHLIEQELGDGTSLGLRITYSPEAVILGTGGGLKQAERLLGKESFLVLNGDTLVDLDVAALIRCHEHAGALATMVLRDDPEAEKWGLVELDGAQHVIRINRQGLAQPVAAMARMFAGIHVMHPRLLRDVPVGRESSIIDAYVREIGHGATVFGYTMSGYWSDVGTPERYAQVQRDAERGVIKLADRLSGLPDALRPR
jgi:NDP-sugar pyrophosphorylase family protein